MNHCGYEFNNGEHSEAAVMHLHSVLQVCTGWIFLLCTVSLYHIFPAICLQDGTAQGLRTSHSTLEGKRRHCLVYRKSRGVHVSVFKIRCSIEIQTKNSGRAWMKSVAVFFHLCPSGLGYHTVLHQEPRQLKGSVRTAKKCPSQQDWTLKCAF